MDESGIVIGQQYEEAIQEIVSMGFDRAQALAAMRAAYNNPARAVDYLLSGNIP